MAKAVANVTEETRSVSQRLEELGFKPKGLVTRPVLTHAQDSIVVIRILGVATQRPEFVDSDGVVKRHPHVVVVADATSGVEHVYVLNAMTYTSLLEAYPDEGYVGRTFAIYKHVAKPGTFCRVDIVEVE
jgi:hypothetical protein